jgi:hypothetical protein
MRLAGLRSPALSYLSRVRPNIREAKSYQKILKCQSTPRPLGVNFKHLIYIKGGTKGEDEVLGKDQDAFSLCQ